MHDAWSYLAQNYNLKQIASYEPVEGQRPTLTELQELQEILTEHNIAAFYTEPQKRSTSATRYLREDLGLTIEVLDPIGGTDDRDSFGALMRANVTALTK